MGSGFDSSYSEFSRIRRSWEEEKPPSRRIDGASDGNVLQSGLDATLATRLIGTVLFHLFSFGRVFSTRSRSTRLSGRALKGYRRFQQFAEGQIDQLQFSNVLQPLVL